MHLAKAWCQAGDHFPSRQVKRCYPVISNERFILLYEQVKICHFSIRKSNDFTFQHKKLKKVMNFSRQVSKVWSVYDTRKEELHRSVGAIPGFYTARQLNFTPQVQQSGEVAPPQKLNSAASAKEELYCTTARIAAVDLNLFLRRVFSTVEEKAKLS